MTYDVNKLEQVGLTTVTDLLLNFAAACRALVPALDFAGVPYRDLEQYDNLDRISEPLFETLVIEPCIFSAVGEAGLSDLKVAKYGYLDANANYDAYLALDDDRLRRFVGLSSETSPFNQIIVLDGDGVITCLPLAGASSAFAFTARDGAKEKVGVVDLRAG